MNKRQLHRLFAKAIETKRKPGRYADGGGLYLQIGPTGGKSWLFRYTLDGKAHEMGLGPVHTVPLASQTVIGADGARREIRGARDLAADMRRLLLEGRDPIASRDNERAELQLAALRGGKTFKECAAAYIKAHRAGWSNDKHAAQWTTTLDTYAGKTLGPMPVAKIETSHVHEVLEPIWHGKTETASRVRARIENVLGWSIGKKYRDGPNPARWKDNLDALLPKRSKVAKVAHHPALPFDEAGAFMASLRKLDGVAPRALEFVILTAMRTGETIGARWEEIDLRGKLWCVPPHRMKMKREHRVPLSPAAVEVLEQMKAIRESAYVFPGQREDAPLSNMALLAVLDRMKRTDITVHGFRSTFRDWAAERTNFPNFVVEMALAHAVGDKVEAAYRRGDLFEKRRKLMEAWAQHCAKAKSATVTTIHAAKHA